MPTNPHHYKADGQLNWDAIRIDYLAKASPAELEVCRMTVAEIFERRGWDRPGSPKKSSIDKLPVLKGTEVHPNTRIAIIMDYQNEKSIREIAEERRFNPKTIRNVLQGAGAYDDERGLEK